MIIATSFPQGLNLLYSVKPAHPKGNRMVMAKSPPDGSELMATDLPLQCGLTRFFILHPVAFMRDSALR